MHGQDFFYQALIFLSAAVISVPVARKLGLGSVLGYLFAGVIIGPYFLNLVGEEGTDILHFAEFGVVMMLFLIGLEVRPALLWSMRREILGLGGMQLTLSTLVIGSISLFFGMNLLQSLTIGMIFSMSSTAIVLQTLAEKGLMKTRAGQGSFSVLLFQDIAIIPILAILPLFANQVEPGGITEHLPEAGAAAAGGVSALPGWQQLFIIIALVGAITLGGKFLARHVFRFIARTGLREVFTATALLLVIGIAMAMDSVGLSPALGTFLAGVVLADNEYRHELEITIEPFKGLLLGLFFIAVGASIDFSILLADPARVAGLLGLLILVKFFILLVLGRLFRMRLGQGLLFSFALAQTGEFAFVLISFSGQNAILPEPVAGVMLIVVALSMLVTPLLLIINERIAQPLFSRTVAEKQGDDIPDRDSEVIIAGYGRFGVVIGRLLKANGIHATVLDNNPDNIRFLRRFGMKVYYGDANRQDLLEAAGIGKARILIVAVDHRDQINHIIREVRQKYPHIRVYARAVDVRHSFELMDMGIDGVQRETYDSSLSLGAEVLSALGFSRFQASRSARSFRYHDREMMDKLHRIWAVDRNRRKYLNEARRFQEELNKMILADKDHALHESDAAWDVETLRDEVREIYEEMMGSDEEGKGA